MQNLRVIIFVATAMLFLTAFIILCIQTVSVAKKMSHNVKSGDIKNALISPAERKRIIILLVINVVLSALISAGAGLLRGVDNFSFIETIEGLGILLIMPPYSLVYAVVANLFYKNSKLKKQNIENSDSGS